MAKVTKSDIRKYYSVRKVVLGYDSRRFSGYGGRYINQTELGTNIKLLIEGINPNKNVRVLDVGAGKGRLTSQIFKRGYDVYCLDSSKEMAGFLRSVVSPRKIIICSAFDRFSMKYKFDAVTALRFFDHFSILDQRKILENILKHLDSQGIIIFSALNRSGLEHIFSRIFYFGKVNFYYTDAEYKKLFSSLNLTIIKRDQKFFLPRGIYLAFRNIKPVVTFLQTIDKLILNLFPSNGSSFVYLLKKI